jgi:hypothetical protein
MMLVNSIAWHVIMLLNFAPEAQTLYLSQDADHPQSPQGLEFLQAFSKEVP